MKLAGNDRVEAEAAAKVLGCEAHRKAALDIARRSMTLLRGKAPLLRPGRPLLAVIVRGKRHTDVESHEVLAAELKKHAGRVNCLFVDVAAGAKEAKQVEQAAAQAEQVLFTTFARVEAYRETSGGAAPAQEEIVRALAAAGMPFTAVSFGSPYVLGRLTAAHNLLAAWYDSDVCIQAACEVLFGTRKPTGKSPVTIPGL
jgi:beta-glucosidase